VQESVAEYEPPQSKKGQHQHRSHKPFGVDALFQQVSLLLPS
jgi:hypothetical protein